MRGEDHARQCLLVVIGVRLDGKKELVTLGDGMRETMAAWLELLRDLTVRGLQIGPRLAVGDGALGFGGALDEVYPESRRQRCWAHKTANVLNALPKSLQANAKAQLHEVWMAPTRLAAQAAFSRFVQTYQAKYPKAVDKLIAERNDLLAFHDFPAAHWMHLRTTNPIESTCATVRHRTNRTKYCVSRATFLGLAFKLYNKLRSLGAGYSALSVLPSSCTASSSKMLNL